MIKRTDECFACNSRKCHTRIFASGQFDEVACSKHAKDLERYADSFLKGQPRVHTGSSERLRREPSPAKRTA